LNIFAIIFFQLHFFVSLPFQFISRFHIDMTLFHSFRRRSADR